MNRVALHMQAARKRARVRCTTHIGNGLIRRLDGPPIKGATTGEDAITTFTYTATGEVSRISPPDGDFLDYEYDDAHRLVAIEDAAGNRIEYTLDAAGNRTAETTQDASAAVTRQLSRTYDLLNRLIEQRDAHNQPTRFAYDANGNQTGTEDALGIQSQQAFDPLDRLRQTVQDVGDIEAQTGFEYDPLDRLTRVTDPKGLDTGYAYDGLGNLTQLTSPDTGITTYAYDAAGNRSSQTDARGVTAAYSHDALNRLTAITYPDSALNVAYHYDEVNAVTGCATSFPKGRLTRMIDASGTTAYCHDRRGNVTRKRLTQGGQTYTIGYAHTRGDRLAAITYPDTTTLTYGRDALGQVATITQTGITPTRPIVTSTTYRPFGPIAQIGFAGGTSQSFTYDNNHWPTAIAGTALNLSFGHDARGNIKRIEGITDAALSRDYAYDALSRLILSSLPPEGGETSRVSALLPLEHYVYDATGNRLSKEQNLPFLPSVYQAYGYPQGSHRLTGVGSQSRTYDAMGNLTARGSQAFGYGDDQRLKQFSPSSFSLPTTYIHNGKGERAIKQTDQIVIGEDGLLEYGYLYDEQGRLLAEYRTATSQLSRLYVWLDDRPIAVQPKAGSYANEWLHVHSDHLGTPRAITRPSQANATIWRWSPTQTAFGEHAPEQDPDGDSDPFTFNLRYPGQYFDAESGLHYNYFRDYEPSTGRYVQSDPIGLDGGASTYAYALSNPSRFADTFGLFVCFTTVDCACIKDPKNCPKPAPNPAPPPSPKPVPLFPPADKGKTCPTCKSDYPEFDLCFEIAADYPYASAKHALLDRVPPRGVTAVPMVSGAGGVTGFSLPCLAVVRWTGRQTARSWCHAACNGRVGRPIRRSARAARRR